VRIAAEFLWANYQAKGALIGGGISAFPSMHVAIAAWLAIVLNDRGWPKLGMAYFFGVFACSVILGWHYAIDGIAGAAIAIVADRIAQSWHRRSRASAGPAGQPAVASR
jgi:membrane-associated phospholipid phosphatase